jgi:hypothetical protein
MEASADTLRSIWTFMAIILFIPFPGFCFPREAG